MNPVAPHAGAWIETVEKLPYDLNRSLGRSSRRSVD